MDDHAFTSAVYYRDPKAAISWLERAFGFEISMAIEGPPDTPEMSHYEMSASGAGRIVIGGQWAAWTRSPESLAGANTQTVSVRVAADIDKHCARARAAGAVIAQEPDDQFYGDRTYRAIDPEGHCWTFAMPVREVSRADAEAAIGQRIIAPGWK